MFKKILLISILIAYSGMIFAGTPYLGAGIGIGSSGTVNLFGGYGAAMGEEENYYLAGEVFGNLFSSQNDNTNYCQYGASLLPGYFINPATIVYGRLGVGASTQNRANSNNTTYAQIGAGLQKDFSDKLTLRGEFVHNTYVPTANELNAGLVIKLN